MCFENENGPQGQFVLSFNINVRIYSLRFIVVVSICCGVVRKYITLAVGRRDVRASRKAQQDGSFV
jgi:hypothetical protein